jgi:hypothetical protein
MALVPDNRLGTLLRRRSHIEMLPVQYSARLPSRLDGACFRAGILVLGAPGQDDPVIDARVYERMVTTARAVSQRYSVLDDAEACNAVKIALSDHCPLADLDVRIEVVHVELAPWPGAAELAAAYEQLAAETALARERHKAEARRLSLFRDHVLSSAGMARLWWVRNDPERLVRLAEMEDGVFDKCIALVAGTGPDRAASDRIAAIIESFLHDLGPEHRALLLTQIGQVLDGYERTDLADQLESAQLELAQLESEPLGAGHLEAEPVLSAATGEDWGQETWPGDRPDGGGR